MSANNKHAKRDLETQTEAGSPHREPAFVVVGKFRRPHGVRGEILLEVMTDFPERLVTGKVIFVGEAKSEVKILAARPHHQGLLLKLDGFDDPESVGLMRNHLVYVPTRDLPALSEGEFYLHQMIGMEVFDTAGKLLGKLMEVMETGANDVYVIQMPGENELLIPAIDSVIIDIIIEDQRMIVNPPEWH
ncbi:MAG: 16S rRNA processing protein RimM [Anaerolineaceae bacterium]|nr:16S rRNA processing protein RimM [Anaerolineaceae bacterium]